MIYQNYRDNPQRQDEFNRIVGVLQRNLNPSSCPQANLPASIKDPKRSQITALLDKHFQMKEEQKECSNTIIFSPEKDTFISKYKNGENQEMLKGLSEVLSKLESNCDKNSIIHELRHSEFLNCQPSKGETLQFLPDYDYSNNHDMKGDHREISMEFENISKISSSSSSEDLPEQKPATVKQLMSKYLEGKTAEDKKKFKVILSLMQIYSMTRSSNPFDFSHILKVWSSLQLNKISE